MAPSRFGGLSWRPLRYLRGLTTFGRFEGWSRAIREPLIWLGMADPCDTRKKIEMRDPVRDSLGALLDAWFDLLGGTDGYTVPQAIRAVENAPEIGDRRDQANALRDAMLDISDGDKINPRKVGKFIARHERRIEGYLSFEQDSDFRRAKKWRVADHRSIRLAVSDDDDKLLQSNYRSSSAERKQPLF